MQSFHPLWCWIRNISQMTRPVPGPCTSAQMLSSCDGGREPVMCKMQQQRVDLPITDSSSAVSDEDKQNKKTGKTHALAGSYASDGNITLWELS